MKVIVISGPTASGKTNLSIEIAKAHNGEVVNFDSLLFYKEINIGTAKPTTAELLEVPHNLINIRSINQPINASDFSKLALPVIKEILLRKKNVILVGGSGFYLQALLKGMYDSPTTPQEILIRSESLFIEKGIDPFIEELKRHDPKSLEKLHPNDHYRIIRATQHWWTHGTTFSAAKEQQSKIMVLENGNIHGWDLKHIYLNPPKEDHLRIIEQRSKNMIHDGLIEEVRNLLQEGFSSNLKPLQSIGYKETIEYINGDIKNTEELIEKIIISTRQLAKSQRTWFNRDSEKNEFNPLTDNFAIHKFIEQFLEISRTDL